MATLGFYFAGLSPDQANQVRAKLNMLAADLGYFAVGGPTMGEGNAAALLVALARGELRIERVPSGEQSDDTTP